MDVSARESFSYDESLLDRRALKNFLILDEILKRFPKKSGVECVFCEESTKIHNLHDMFRAYACAVSCLAHHTESVGVADLLVFFEVEDFVMRKARGREMWSVRDVLEFRRDTKEMYEEALRDQLVAVFKTHFMEKSIKINCEQDVESITYKYYKLVDDGEKTGLEMRSLELVLILLFKRDELIRFFRVFWPNRKSYAVFKLALILSMRLESHVSTERLLKEFEGFPFEEDSLFPYNGDVDSLHEINEMLENSEPDIGEWFRMQQEKMYWMECVRMWAANRESDPGTMDNSMIELCIKNKRYEDGWLIYKNDMKSTNVGIVKACILCIKGLKSSNGSCVWESRTAEVIDNAVFSGDLKSLHALINEIVSKLWEIPAVQRVFVLGRFSKAADCMCKDEDLIAELLKGLQALCTECRDSETRDLCVRYSEMVYDEWKKAKKKFLFFKKQSHHGLQIRSSMLGIYGATKDCKKFYNVYQDLMKSNTELSRELCTKLESLHIRDCEECILRRRQLTVNGNRKAPPVFNFLNKP
ncbi:hypothetical protein [Encephalitozoon cuniculi GB-M1]|uniref:Uncharacterized protein n=1 Tax=Encephalitozoon cuniculi (strain GB-M1) TaxID=284813 RepID=Q8SVE2_ENCCU|nr:uncharacterized protein ECU06_0300 [Encephalitozoon cuniculi GB-M1]CAD25390.1 hypothetical protein [Encephalitozoon cuniculi GB-M1]